MPSLQHVPLESLSTGMSKLGMSLYVHAWFIRSLTDSKIRTHFMQSHQLLDLLKYAMRVHRLKDAYMSCCVVHRQAKSRDSLVSEHC